MDAVLFDLDDTLFLQEQWLDGAWTAVANRARELGADGDRLDAALRRIAAGGTAAGGIIDRALVECEAPDLPVVELVAAFRDHHAERLEPLPGVREGLRRLRSRCPIGLVSDGAVPIQQGKLESLGLAAHFDAIVWSDTLGREHRKPDPSPFLAALAVLDVPADRAVYVGDNPRKDIAGANELGMRSVRVRTGEYAQDPGPDPWMDVPDVAAALEQLLDHFDRAAVTGH